MIFFPFLLSFIFALGATPDADKLSQEFIESLAVSRSDVDLANHFYTVYKMVEKKDNVIKFDIIEKTIRESANSTLFPEANAYLLSLKTILKSNESNILEACGKPEFKAKYLNEQLTVICQKRIINFLEKRDIDDYTNFKTFFSQNILSLVQNHDSNDLYRLLEPKAKKGFRAFLNETLVSFYLSNQGYVDETVVKLLDPSPELTRLIQLSKLDLLGSEKIFKDSLDLQIKNVVLAADEKEDNAVIKKSVHTILRYYQLNPEIFNTNDFARNILFLGKSLNNRGYPDEAREVYSFLIINKIKYVFEKSHFEILWSYLNNFEYDKAFEIAEKLGIVDNLAKFKNGKIHFWMGILHAHKGNKSEAISIFTKMIENSPISYYSIMASKKIQELDPSHDIIKYYSTSRKTNPEFKTSEFTQDELNYLKRVKIWGQLGYLKFLNFETSLLRRVSIPKEKKINLYFATALALFDVKNHLESFKIIYKGFSKKYLSLNALSLKILYPNTFIEKINEYSSQIDPMIVISLMRQESAFNPNAASPVGARGLMQLMPYTARRILPGTNSYNITNPDRNIKCGVKYLKSLLTRYDNNLVYTLSAYNAGENRVKRWRETLFKNDSILHTVESIPFKETKQYVKLIFRNIFFYKLMKGPEEVADTSSFNHLYDLSVR